MKDVNALNTTVRNQARLMRYLKKTYKSYEPDSTLARGTLLEVLLVQQRLIWIKYLREDIFKRVFVEPYVDVFEDNEVTIKRKVRWLSTIFCKAVWKLYYCRGLRDTDVGYKIRDLGIKIIREKRDDRLAIPITHLYAYITLRDRSVQWEFPHLEFKSKKPSDDVDEWLEYFKSLHMKGHRINETSKERKKRLDREEELRDNMCK